MCAQVSNVGLISLHRKRYAYSTLHIFRERTRSVSWLNQRMKIPSTGKRLEKRRSHIYAICSVLIRATLLATRYVQPGTCTRSLSPRASPVTYWDRARIEVRSSPGSREMDRYLHSC